VQVLIAEAEAGARGDLEATLNEWGYEMAAVATAEEAREWLEKSQAPAVVILGGIEEEHGRAELCRWIREQRAHPYTYVLLLAPPEAGGDLAEAMEAGSDDYLTRPFKPLALKVHLRTGKRILDLREELRRSKETIGYQLHHDSLTGLWNRAAVIDILRRELARAGREKSSVAIIMAAVDGLKNINENFSHTVGDHVIRVTARRFRSSLRPYDALGRYSGGMFLVVVPGCNPRYAVRQAERLQACVSARPIEIPPWGKFSSALAGAMSVTVSFGVIAGEHEDDLEKLLHAAEEAAGRAGSLGVSQIEQGTLPSELPEVG
jgi:diguanylate cyclase (GGDEF)-like protein